jgi:asparagine synthase (glutamine-hydrolysing)
MCGIVGIIDIKDPEGVSVSRLHRMTNKLLHRGPDSDGFYSSYPIGMGIRRLRIIDLNTGDQPISNEDGTIITVFNGEIYNYAELRAELISKGHIFSTQSDTEVIVHQYEEDGESCVNKFRGMFAIAIWDAKRQRLILVRDRFGIKPLFIAEKDGCLAFASEMKALFPVEWVDLSWNPTALRAYLSVGYIPCPLTAFLGIHKFPQGTIGVWEVDASKRLNLRESRRYWSPSTAHVTPAPSYEEACANVLELMKESIRLHLRSDVPLGAFLSGGVDSSSVVVLMRLCGVTDLRTFSIGFDDEKYNELSYAEQISRHLQTNHTAHVITGAEAKELLPMVEGFDEPFADSSAIPTYYVSKLAREQVMVALSGDGGDEVFAGYDNYKRLTRYRLFDRLPQAARQCLGLAGAWLIPEKSRGGGFVRRLGAKPGYRHLSFISDALMGHMRESFSPRFASWLDEEDDDSVWQKAYKCNDFIEEAQIVDQSTYLVDNCLVKVDRASMFVSLEARVPLLDHVLVEYVNSLPTDYKFRSGYSKWLLKKIIEPFVPPGFLQRPKKGFAIPLRTWLTGPLFSSVQEYLLGQKVDLYDELGISRLINALRNGDRDVGGVVWKLMILSLWASRIDNSRPF